MSESKIRAVRARAVRVPLAEPHNTASGSVAESPLVLTDVECDDGVVGHGLVFTYTPAALRPVAELVVNFGAWIAGDAAAPLDVEPRPKFPGRRNANAALDYRLATSEAPGAARARLAPAM
jgi:L-alanine-DL-glutamate epimerase-like enolase superfamily enzyme